MLDFAKSIMVGNATIKFYGETIDLTKKSESDLKEILEELQMMHEGSDEQRAIKEELKRRQTGNSRVENADIFKDGRVWVVLYAEGTKSKEFDSEAEAKRFAAQVGNSKVGNATDRNGKELKVGDMVAVKTSDPKLNHGRIVRISGDQISVDVTGENDIWTTPARQAVKMG